MESLLDARQVAELLGVSRVRVYRLVETPDDEIRLPHVRVGRTALRFRPSEVEAWLDRRSRS